MTVQLRFQEGRLQLGGVVNFDNASDVCNQGLVHLRDAGSLIIVDLQGLQSGGSIDVAVLLQWVRAAARAKKQIRFDHVSAKLQAIIRVSGLKDVLLLVTP